MEKMNCDIIQDLIPSYVDGICSDATKECVESHIEDCSQCREMVRLCRDNVLTDENTEKLVINGFQKIKKSMKKQFISNIVLIILVCFSMQKSYYFTESFVTSFAILLIICMFANLLINMSGQTQAQKQDYIIGLLSLTISIGIASLFHYVVQRALINEAEPVFFGLEPQLCGPFLDRLFTVVFLIQLAFFIYCLFGINKLHKNLLPLSCLAVAELFQASAYLSLLGRLDTPESFFALFFNLNITCVVIAVLCITAAVLLTKKRSKNRYDPL